MNKGIRTEKVVMKGLPVLGTAIGQTWMRHGLVFLLLAMGLMLLGQNAQAQTTITSATSGNWNVTTTWVGGVVPVDGNNVTIASGHTVTLVSNTDMTTGNLTVTGTLALAGFNLTAGSLAGGGNIGSTSGTPTVNVGSNGSNTTYSGVFSGTGARLTKEGAGILTIGGSNTYTGATTISAGTLRLSTAIERISNSSAITLASDATFDLNGRTETVGSLAGAGTVTSSLTGSLTLSVGGDNTSTTFSGVIQNGSATSVALSKSGTGTLTLSGNNTYTGTTIISAGILSIGNGGTTGLVAGNITNNATLIFNRSDAITYSRVISGTGSVTKNGGNTLTLTGMNTYSGTTTVTAGTLEFGSDDRIPNNGLVLQGGTFSTGATTGFAETLSTLTLSGNAKIKLGTGVHSLNFAASNGEIWTPGSTLTVDGWTGIPPTSGTAGKIFFGSASGTLTDTQLAQVTFTPYPPGAIILNTGEMVPAAPFGAATQISISSGNNQSAPLNTALTNAPSVLVQDAYNNPVPDVSVTFSVASGGGSITGAIATTDANGIAKVGSWTLGNATGANTLVNTLKATAPGLTGSPVTFTAIASPPNPCLSNNPGCTWTSRSSAADFSWWSVTYGNGLFVAVALAGESSVMTSPDGINWTARTPAANNTWRSVTYGNGLFVAVASSGTGNRVMTSPDGIIWTARSSAADNDWRAVTFGNDLFVAVAETGTGNRVMTSPDGINWTARSSAANNRWRSMTYGNGLFVALSDNRLAGTEHVMTSPDGINWTLRMAAINLVWRAVTYGNGLFVAVAATGTGNRVMTSPDGITWTSRASAADNTWYAITYGNGLFVAVSASGTGNRVMTSPDGITWTAGISATDNDWWGVTYGNGLFVAVAASGTGNRVMTSGGPASKLTITTEPSATAASGTVFTTQPVVQLRDAFNNVVTTAGLTVNATIKTGGGTLSGILTAITDASGMATFTDLAISGVIGNRTLEFTADGLSPATSAAVSLTAGSASQITINTGNNQSATVGNEVFFAPSVLVQDANNNAVQDAPVAISVQSGAGTMYPALMSNITPDYTTGGSDITQNEWRAFLFTNGNTAVKVRGISLMLNNITNTYPANIGVKVAIYSVTGGNPDLQLAASDDRVISLSATKTWVKFLLNSELQLSAGTTYALVVKGLDNTGFKWANTRPSVNPMMYGTASYVGAKFTDNGAWVNGNGGNGFALVIDPGETNALNLTTSAAGIASLGAWTMGNKAGTNSLTATLTGNNPELTRIITAEAISSPEKPTQLSATPSDGQISLSFIPAADGGTVITNYEYSLDEGKTWIAFNPAKISSPLTITNLNNGTRYPVQIRALNGVGAGPASDLVYATPSKSIADLSITLLDVTYNGEEQKVKPLIKNGETILIENTDYTLNYSSNINAGTGNVGITGINRYSGQRQESFIINKANLIIVADNINKVFGTTDPAFTYRLSGLKPNDRESDVLSGNLTRQAGEKPGNYIISQGTLNSNNNYSISFTNAELKITAAQILSFIDFGVIETAWGKNPDLPAQVRVLTTNGQFTLMNISWNVSALNIFARGVYGISGTITLIDGIINPLGIRPTATIKVLPKPAPLQLTLSNNSFEGSTSSFLILVGTFIIDDPVDRNHTLSLTGTLLDNKYFIIKNNELYWNSRDRAEGKTNFNILVILSDRDGNSIEKKFQINRIRKSIEQIRIPNTFTPNGDGMNDTWGLEEMRFFQGATIHIFERGGERLFHTDNPDIRWDGTYKGKHLPTGTYYWKIEIKETGEIRKGILNLIK